MDDDGAPLKRKEETGRKPEATLTEILRKDVPVGMGDKELVAFDGDLRACLAWEPDERMSAGSCWRKNGWQVSGGRRSNEWCMWP